LCNMKSIAAIASAFLLVNAASAVTVLVSNRGSPRGTCQGNDISPGVLFPELGFMCQGSICTYWGDDYDDKCEILKANLAGCSNISCANLRYRGSWGRSSGRESC
ncbi:hypothetical protein BGW38_007608, partial [Lunasporangiospora selenospora]